MSFNGKVGESTTERIPTGSASGKIRLQPGQRVAAHRHVLDYFWTAIQSRIKQATYGRWNYTRSSPT